MLLTRRSHRWTTWLALWSLVLAALLPVLSHATVRAMPNSGWTEICTTTGMVWVHVDTGVASDTDPTQPIVQTQPTCAWCLAHGGTPGLPPVAAPTLSVPVLDTAHALARVVVSPDQRVWLSAPPRAPPALV